MKYWVLILSVLFTSVKVAGCTFNSSFAEIRYEIDSANARVVHITLITTDQWYCVDDSVSLFIASGSALYRQSIPLIDTASVENGYFLKTYKGIVIVDTLESDSVFNIYYSPGSPHYAQNIQTSNPVPINCSIDYAGMSKAGIQSPGFNGARIGYGVVNDTLFYASSLFSGIGDSIYVGLQNGFFINEFPYQIYTAQYPNDTMYINNSSGALTWTYARGEGDYYDILYQADQYRNGHHVGYMQRNMLLYVLSDTVGTEGIIETNNTDVQHISCYPSPSSGNFTIGMSGYTTGEKHITIYDQLEHVVYDAISSGNKATVNVKFSPGIYTVSVFQEGIHKYARIVIE